MTSQKIVKPEMIVDDFMGDQYLGCHYCKEAIIFPFGKRPGTYKPPKCVHCGSVFIWEGVKI